MRRMGGIWLVWLALLTGAVVAVARDRDYVVLRNGRVIEGAILRQDSVSVTMTEWESRGLLLPPLQVYTKAEIQSIWFTRPGQGARDRVLFKPKPLQFELAAGLALQTEEGTEFDRETLFQANLLGGIAFTKQFGFEIDAIYSGPSKSTGFQRGFQTLANLAVYPVEWRGLIPFAVAGGGAAIAVPFDRGMLAKSDTLGETNVGNVVDFGLGVKLGADRVGARFEVRHHYYNWSVLRPYGTEVVDGETVTLSRRERVEADMTVFRVSLFTYF